MATKLTSPAPQLMFARMIPAIFEDSEAGSVESGDCATANIPAVVRRTKHMIRTEYGTSWMKYGVMTLVARPGTIQLRRTVALGMLGPTRSRAAVKIMT